MKNKIINTFLIFLFGVILGVFSKWLDNLSIDDSVWWQHILGILDLRNVFTLFGIWLNFIMQDINDNIMVKPLMIYLKGKNYVIEKIFWII